MRQKLRYDMGGWLTDIFQWAGIVFLCLDRICAIVHVQSRVAIALTVLAAVARWLLGLAFDRFALMHAYQDEMNERNEVMRRIGGERLAYQMRIERFVRDRLSEVVDGDRVIGMRLNLDVQQTEKFIQEIQR